MAKSGWCIDLAHGTACHWLSCDCACHHGQAPTRFRDVSKSTEEGIDMATKTITTMMDDLDGSEAAETVTFGLDGISYEIDLSQENALKLREAVGTFLPHARKAAGAKPTRGHTQTRIPLGPDPKAIRAWAQSNGIEVPQRGRIPKAIVTQFEAAQGAQHDVTPVDDAGHGRRGRRSQEAAAS